MRVIGKENYEDEKEEIDEMIKQGAVFIYPTDTIYGIGCDATNSKSVRKIRELKKREEKPFSVIAPSKKWIIENCDVTSQEWLAKLPGPYTLIMKLKNKKCVCSEVNNNANMTDTLRTLGIRMPKHWVLTVVKDLGIPIVTTSVNRSGEKNMTSLDDIDLDIADGVDFILYDGDKNGSPSTIVDLTGYEPKVITRK